MKAITALLATTLQDARAAPTPAQPGFPPTERHSPCCSAPSASTAPSPSPSPGTSGLAGASAAATLLVAPHRPDDRAQVRL